MCRLLETIKLSDGKIYNLTHHNQRLKTSYRICFGKESTFDLYEIINIPPGFLKGLVKVRVIYGEHDYRVEYHPYQYKQIENLKLVTSSTIQYPLKFEDRKELEKLFGQRGDCDDIIIVKDGLVTDSFAANLIFFDGENWLTPDTPLLKGTMRANLLEQGVIKESRILVSDIRHFISVGLINAFHSFENMPVVPVCRIKNK